MYPRCVWGGRALLLVGLWLPGCAGGPKATDGHDTRALLEEIAELYQQHKASKKRAPSRLADLQAYNPLAPTGFPALEAGDLVAVWGAALSDAPAAANAVLVYEKNAHQQGGHVLMQDGKVRKMTAQEFQAAPKAKK
jgi:hypothetical protein